MIVDIIVGAVLLVSAIISFIRGLIREVLTIFGVGGGLVASYFLGGSISGLVEGWITPEESNFELEDTASKLFDIIPYPLAADLLAYAAVFIVVVGVLSVASHFLAEGLKKMGLGAIDRTLGVIFGLIRGVLVLGFLYLPIYMLAQAETKNSWFKGSRTYVYLEKTSGMISEFLPKQDSQMQIEEDSKPNKHDIFDTRKTLEKLDVLRKDVQELGTEIKKNGAGTGYDDNFRDNMNKLFEGDGLPINKQR